jgi:hypothetical protein
VGGDAEQMVEQLDWDDDGPTRETLRPPTSALVSSQLAQSKAPPRPRASKPRNLVLVSGSQHRTLVAPAYEEDAAATERDPQPSGRATLVSAAPPDSEPPASSIRELGWEPLPSSLPTSLPIPLTDDFDHRETNRLPSTVPPPPSAVRSTHTLEAALLAREVASLRRWVVATTALATAALLLALALLGLVLLRDAPQPSLGHASLQPTPPRARVDAPAPPVTDPAPATQAEPAAEPAEAPAPVDTAKIRVTVAFAGGGSASVMLARPGAPPEQLPGPWPRVLELDPGTYVLTAVRRGRPGFVRTLDLTPDRPQREVVIQLAGM